MMLREASRKRESDKAAEASIALDIYESLARDLTTDDETVSVGSEPEFKHPHRRKTA